MDIKFNASAAEQLITQMDFYCSGIVRETRDLLNIVEDTKLWSDNQKQAFQNNIKALAQDLNKALSLESDYMRTFKQRVNELRG